MSFFDLSEEERKKIMLAAGEEAGKQQRLLLQVERYLRNIRRDMSLSDQEIVDRQFQKIFIINQEMTKLFRHIRLKQRQLSEGKKVDQVHLGNCVLRYSALQNKSLPFRKAVISWLQEKHG